MRKKSNNKVQTILLFGCRDYKIFYFNVKEAEGKHMRPQRGNDSKKIQINFFRPKNCKIQ